MELNNKCECDEWARPMPFFSSLYDPVTERPFIEHEPGKCLCTNNLKLYRNKDTGKILTLCSCCHCTEHEEID